VKRDNGRSATAEVAGSSSEALTKIVVFQTREYQGSVGLAQSHCLRFEMYVFGLCDIALGERFGDHPSKFVRSALSRLSLHLISEENVVS
jgi:hypothetical protein